MCGEGGRRPCSLGGQDMRRIESAPMLAQRIPLRIERKRWGGGWCHRSDHIRQNLRHAPTETEVPKRRLHGRPRRPIAKHHLAAIRRCHALHRPLRQRRHRTRPPRRRIGPAGELRQRRDRRHHFDTIKGQDLAARPERRSNRRLHDMRDNQPPGLRGPQPSHLKRQKGDMAEKRRRQHIGRVQIAQRGKARGQGGMKTERGGMRWHGPHQFRRIDVMAFSLLRQMRIMRRQHICRRRHQRRLIGGIKRWDPASKIRQGLALRPRNPGFVNALTHIAFPS